MICLFKRLTVFVIAGIILTFSFSQHVKAQDAADGASVTLAVLEQNALAQGASDADIQSLVNAALAQYPQGGAELTALVSRLVVASPRLADAFLQAGRLANSAQKSALGAGLGQAASIINEKDPEAATAIAQLVAAANDKEMQTAFAASVGDDTAATGDGTAGTGTGGGATGGRASGPRAGSLSVQSSGGGSGGGDPVSPSS